MAGGDFSGTARRTTAERRQEVVRLRDSGMTYPEIATHMGLALSTVWNHYQNAMREIPAEAVARHRANLEQRVAEQLSRIDMERQLLMGILSRHHVSFDVKGQVILFNGEYYEDCKPAMEAIRVMVALDDQEAKLLGLHAAQKLQADVTVNYTLVGVNLDDLS